MDVVIMAGIAMLCCMISYTYLDYYGYVGRTTGNVSIGLVIMTAAIMLVGYCVMSIVLDMTSLRLLYGAG